MPQVFWQEFCKAHQCSIKMPEAWMFGDGSKVMGDQLGRLVLAGKKTATCSALALYRLNNETIPEVGQYSIILDGDRKPIAIIRVKEVSILKMVEVDADFAKKEGEGDLSYQYWYDTHLDFFTKEFADHGLAFSAEQQLVCEEFEVVYR